MARTARFSQIGKVDDSTRQLWVVCHGYRQLASRFIRRFTGLVDLGCVVVAPEALSRFYIDVAPGRHGSEARIGASWMTRADREAEIRDYVRYLDKLVGKVLEKRPGDSLTVVALGFSQGAHTAARWATLGTTQIHELVLWGAYFPSDADLGLDVPASRLTLVYGDEDPTRDAQAERNQDERLAAAERHVQRLTYSGGHRIHPEPLTELASGF
ncbi:MAG: alpha/beta hydrolase [Longimicrobiales bacterium]